MNSREHFQQFTRRALLGKLSTGVGGIALASLLAEDAAAKPEPADPMAPKAPHFAPKAKNVIFLHMVGAPSHLDLFENKPALKKHDGQECPPEYLEGARFAFIRGTPKLLGSEFEFKKHGESGMELSSLLPHLSTVADDMAMIKTLHTTQFNHGPAQLFFHTGFPRFGRPVAGSWITYGLGSENRNLPGYVVLITGSVGGAGNSMWGSGFLPSVYQGVEFRSQGDPVLFLSNPKGIDAQDRKQIVDSVNHLNNERQYAPRAIAPDHRRLRRHRGGQGREHESAVEREGPHRPGDDRCRRTGRTDQREYGHHRTDQRQYGNRPGVCLCCPWLPAESHHARKHDAGASPNAQGTRG